MRNNTSLQCHTHFVLSWVTAETTSNKTFAKKSSLTKILINWGGVFHDINLKNNGAIVIPEFPTILG